MHHPTQLVVDRSNRLDRYLHEEWPDCSRARIVRWIDDALILVNGEVRRSSFMLKPGMIISWGELPDREPHSLDPAQIDLKILFEDEHMIVVEKPRGMATHPAPGLREATLVNALLGRDQPSLSSGSSEFRPGIVHRLDKETTGLLLVAKNDAAHEDLAAQIAEKRVVRRYLGRCRGNLPEERLRIEAPIARDPKDRRKMTVHPKGKSSVTHILRLKEESHTTLFAAQLETGRTHQIRVHMLAAGYPLVGDAIYAKGSDATGAMQLHAALLIVEHPVTRERMEFSVPPPSDFMDCSAHDFQKMLAWTLSDFSGPRP